MTDELERLEASAKSESGEHFAHGDKRRLAGDSRSPSATATAPPPPTDSAPPVAAAPAAISGSGRGAPPPARKAVPPVPAASIEEASGIACSLAKGENLLFKRLPIITVTMVMSF